MSVNSERVGLPVRYANDSLKVCVQESHVTQRKSYAFGCYELYK